MAKQMAITELSNAQMASFGLRDTSLEDEPVQEDEKEDKETDESADESDASDDDSSMSLMADTSDDEGQEETLDDEDDDGTEKKRKLTKTEKQLREFQSRHDRLDSENKNLRAQVQQLYQEFIALKDRPIEEQTSPTQDIDLGDDDFIDGKTLKKILSQQSKPKNNPDKERASQLAEQNWLNSREDLSEIQEYINSNNLAHDQQFQSIPTNGPGVYYAVKSKRQEAKIAELEQQIKKLKGSSAKKPIPPTGGKSGGNLSSRKGSPSSGMEKVFANLGKKYGIDLTVGSR